MNRFRSIMFTRKIKNWLSSPFIQRLEWVLFAILFYQSGLAFTQYVLQTDFIASGWQWAGIIAFPFLLPAFFFINRYLGCASAHCPVENQVKYAGKPAAQQDNENNKQVLYFRPPG